MSNLLTNYLNAMEQVILQLVDSQHATFKLIEGDALWAKQLFPISTQQHIFAIDDSLPFLQDFLIDARLIWHGSKNARLHSGFWTEVLTTNEELHLEAIAIKQDEYQLLVIANQSDEFKFRQTTMQKARELILSNDQLLEQNEYLHARLLDILKQPAKPHDVLLTLTKAIENAGFAVFITDENLTTIIENTAAQNLFDPKRPEKSSTPSIDILLDLMKNQLPEYERIFTTHSSWDGELCWMSPPATLKWLKTSLYPVTNELNEITNWIAFVNDISSIKHLVQRNEQLALQDMLTNLPNRFNFWQTLEKQLHSNTPFYLLYVDINEFRRHNEFYGHDEGDKLLVELSGRIKNSLKETDYIARVGGDEFAIILSNIDNQTCCENVIQRIFDFTSQAFYTKQSESFNISLSIGAASFPYDARSVEELMKFVDLSAYSGKKSKINSLSFYSQAMKDASHKAIELEHQLSEAIKRNEFELYLQPIVDIKSHKIIKAEALIRWHHSEKGMIPPDQFIPIAEKSELIITIGKWVITKVCQMVHEISLLGYRIKISLNLSPSQVLDSNLFSYLYNNVKKYRVDPSLIELEVTEGVLVDDYLTTEKLLSKVRALGMTVSVDDFGTGYSSLAYLKKLPLDCLKIDRSFIKDIVSDDNDKAIVRAVIAMAHNINLGVIAEGVETQAQLDFLTMNLCNSVQGYLFSRPVTLADFIKLLSNQK